jgi:hypothetical protein
MLLARHLTITAKKVKSVLWHGQPRIESSSRLFLIRLRIDEIKTGREARVGEQT